MGLLVDQIQILRTDMTRIALQTVRRLTNEILGMKGLKILLPFAAAPR